MPGRAAGEDPYDALLVAASLLQKAGVPFAFRTGGATNARNLPEHAGLAVAHGLSREVAWHAMTLGAAEIFGVGELYGSLEVGKIANLVVSDGDLLDVPTQVRHVFIRGQEIDLESRHTRLWKKFKARPRDTK
jgi:imidazolonepropionase-like amidohydrolase